MIHPSEWFRVTPELPWTRWLVRQRLLFAFTPKTDWRFQIGVSRDVGGFVVVLSIGPLHLAWYSFREAQP